MIQRICGHSSPYTFKKNERYGKDRLEKFMSKQCPACTVAAIKAREAAQKAESQKRKEALKKQKQAAAGEK